MRIGYNTNGLAHHDLLDAIDLLAQIGYQSVAITLDHHALNPYSADCRRQLEEVRQRLARHGLASVVETGARYLLDPNIKHEPTLVTADSRGRQRRIEFLGQAIDLAADLNSDCVSLWSGTVRDGAPDEAVWKRLTEGLGQVLTHAGRRGVRIGFEPEPGMFIDTMARFERLQNGVNAPLLQLTLDVGHLHCQRETPLADWICRFGSSLVNVHLEDMRAGVHEHLMFGEGEIDFGPVFQAFRRIGYLGGVHVELSRHSHEGPQAARRSWDFLRAFVEAAR
jgi:sugar phosphate isomerase/epimerase